MDSAGVFSEEGALELKVPCNQGGEDCRLAEIAG